MVSTYCLKYRILLPYFLEKKGWNAMEYRSRRVDSVRKWLLVVPALTIFSFSPAPGFLRMAQAQNPPSAQVPPAAQTPAERQPLTYVTGHAARGEDLRIVAKFSNHGGALKATMYSIDQGGQLIPAASASLVGALSSLRSDDLRQL